jgi:uncharacterized protein
MKPTLNDSSPNRCQLSGTRRHRLTAYAAFKRGDIQTILDILTKGVEWIAPGVEPVVGTYHGLDEVARFFQQVNEISELSSFEPEEYVSQGDRVVALGHYRATMRNTGPEYDCDWAMASAFRDGKISVRVIHPSLIPLGWRN